MARRPNYGYEKRQKELRKKAKREAKLARKRGLLEPEDNAPSGSAGNTPAPDAAAPAPTPPTDEG